MISNVFLKFIEFTLLQGKYHPFSNKYGATTASSILTEFLSYEDIANTSTEEFVDFVNIKSCKRISNPQMPAEILQQAHVIHIVLISVCISH